MTTRIKICGLTRPQDAQAAAQLGADALGLVFYAASPRHVSIEQARAVIAGLPPFISVVGLFVNAPAEQVRATLQQVALDRLQFHGEEPPDYCASFGRPYFKAIRVCPDIDLHAAAEDYAQAGALLLDSCVHGIRGGTGAVFDWTQVPMILQKPLILAGGLHSGNVGEAIRGLRPYAVDVSSGVEADKGIKDPAKMAEFIRACRE
jgi:phosphoribosylanthranilate isomerase